MKLDLCKKIQVFEYVSFKELKTVTESDFLSIPGFS